ncbi:hypothetical protein PC116_g26298 [Phytophthora cactorum]|nr:hypothetical protein PC116_g26298 [Phytophthora cactorum]
METIEVEFVPAKGTVIHTRLTTLKVASLARTLGRRLDAQGSALLPCCASVAADPGVSCPAASSDMLPPLPTRLYWQCCSGYWCSPGALYTDHDGRVRLECREIGSGARRGLRMLRGS